MSKENDDITTYEIRTISFFGADGGSVDDAGMFELELVHYGDKYPEFRPITIKAITTMKFMENLNKGDMIYLNIDIKKIDEDEAEKIKLASKERFKKFRLRDISQNDIENTKGDEK
jgi:hypothetical protein